MSGGGRGAVVQMEEAVKLLVEHLVKSVLPEGLERPYMAKEQQLAIAEQIHKAVIMYNYYHRKMSPQLAFADAKLFLMSLPVGEDLLTHLSMLRKRESKPGNNRRLYTCDRATVKACEIAEGLDASKDSPNMAAWPISKVAVLLLDPERKKCLIEHTQGVWSMIEKEFDEVYSRNKIVVRKSANKRTCAALDGADMLQELALSEVERRTGMKDSNLHVLETFLAYSLSKERTTTKLFLVEYEQAMKGNLVEISLEDLITSMIGSIFANHQFLKITSLLEYYHILPYKEILSELLHRKWPETLVVPTMMNSALPWQNMEVLEKSGMYLARVRLRYLVVKMTIYGDPRKIPLEARCSATANMILELRKVQEIGEQDT